MGIKVRRGGRPPGIKLSKTHSDGVRNNVRQLLSKHGLSRAKFDEMLDKGERFTDNALNQGEKMHADKALCMLDALWQIYQEPSAHALALAIRSRVRGADLPLPMLLPATTVGPLVDAFQRFAVSEAKADFVTAASWGHILRDFLGQVRDVSDWAFRQELSKRIRDGQKRFKVNGAEIDPDIFDNVLVLLSALISSTSDDGWKTIGSQHSEAAKT